MFWDELQGVIGGALAVEGDVSLLYGELPGCEFTLLGNPTGVQVLQLDFSEGENPEEVKKRLTEDQPLGQLLQGAGVQLNGDNAFFMPEQLNWYLRPGKPINPSATATIVRQVASVLTSGAPPRDRFCWGCGEVECGLSRHQRSTVRLCPQCLGMLDNCGQELDTLDKTELEPDDELDLSPLGLENLSPAGQLARGRRLEELFQKSPGTFWARVLFLVALGQAALFGSAIMLTAVALGLVGLVVWSFATGHVAIFLLLAKLGAGGAKAAIALVVLLGVTAKGLLPPRWRTRLPRSCWAAKGSPSSSAGWTVFPSGSGLRGLTSWPWTTRSTPSPQSAARTAAGCAWWASGSPCWSF